MLSLFGILNMAAGSMQTEQEGVAVSGQNMANVNNPAYADEQVAIQATTPLQTNAGMEGTGAEVTAITEIRDALLDQQIQGSTSSTGSLNAQQTALQYVQNLLGEQLSDSSGTASAANVGSTGGLDSDLSGLFSALQTLSTDPSSLTNRQAVISAAQQLSSQFNQVDQSLSTLNTQLNQSVQTDVTSANQLISQIAALNKQIVEAQAASGGSANDFIDEREQDIESLSNLVNLQTTANTNGSVDISIAGDAVVTGDNVEDTLETYDSGGGQLGVASATTGTPLTLSGGSIQGTMEARDGGLASLQTGLNTLASQLISSVNTVYSTGYDLNGNTGAAFFTGTGSANIAVNSALVNDPTAFQASGVAGNSGDNQVALALAQLGNTNQAGLGNQTFSQSYNSTITALGSSLSAVNNQLSEQQSVQTMLTTQRQNETGVNLDQEMTNVMAFEKAYEGSAELVTSLDQMLTTVLQMKQNP